MTLLAKRGTRFDKWLYRTSTETTTGGTYLGRYFVDKDVYPNPFGTDNLADLVRAESGAYGGIEYGSTSDKAPYNTEPLYLTPGQTYWFSVWAFCPPGKTNTFYMMLNTQDSAYTGADKYIYRKDGQPGNYVTSTATCTYFRPTSYSGTGPYPGSDTSGRSPYPPAGIRQPRSGSSSVKVGLR